jgi:hypothetical protein
MLDSQIQHKTRRKEGGRECGEAQRAMPVSIPQ